MDEETKREEALRMINDKLSPVVNAIVAKQKGVLAADASNPAIEKRFERKVCPGNGSGWIISMNDS
jgi:hypothetical protein